jgi:hypothetical protein
LARRALRGILRAVWAKGIRMGWYLRKSLRFGPLRFNLSKSGIGASVGVKGLRIGSGPKGEYLHAGREGLYFRKSLSSRPAAETRDDTLSAEPPEELSRPDAPPPKDWLARTLKRLFLGR